ncbi:MAG: heavy metal sensor histidine kinase [Xanthomonadaceae bacterium]|jgi:two-component system heavy metal sensor histidine kinase CusS|nr:heavy metal sensor histidine kinase [Xanthomonadaceae bacterium]MDE3073639.1 heavy metal sensor histidine kinase [Pseudomonadota bacterium]
MRIERWRAWRSPSIGARLTLLYTVMALLAVALFAGITDWRLSTNFSREQVSFLQSKVAELQTDLDDANGDPQALLAEIAKETGASRLRQYQARVLAADGTTLGETPGMAAALPPREFPVPGMSPGSIEQVRAGRQVYMLAAVPLAGPDDAAPVHLQFALDVTRDAGLLTDFRRALALSFLLLAPLLMLAGRWIAARGLAPLRRISGAARAITPADLSARLPLAPPWPSELDELVRVFNAMLGRIEEAFGRLSRFSADLAHELRTPLANLSGELEVCLMRPRSADDYRAALESGLEECRRLHVLIENLLFMARAEHAEQALRRERFDAAQACAWVVEQLVPGAAARGVRLRIAGEAAMEADPLLFRQALANLLSNAIRHSGAGSEVEIVLATVAGGAEIRVRDHGEGIEAQHLPHLFDRFYQVDAARQRGAGQGTGLGLSIVRAIVEMHRGEVRVESVRGAGTTVSMRFPPGTSRAPELPSAEPHAS